MSIQTSVLIDGRWTTRTIDRDQVIALNRDGGRQEKQSSALIRPQRPPLLGILSQTIIRSPVVKWIIPAQIRHENKNDVVFVYDDYIEIREIVQAENGHMQKVVVKADFDSSIRSARIYGLPRQYYIHDWKTEGYDAIIKKEPQDWQAKPQTQSPPHILVLALGSNKLIFLFALDNNSGQVRFVYYSRPLPSPGLMPKPAAEHLAVDPRSRAMAVAVSGEGPLVLYALRNMDEMRRDLEASGEIRDEDFRPLREERSIAVDGVIGKMEFLHPPESDQDENHVILLLIVSKNGRSKLVCYEWDCSTSLVTAAAKGPGQGLHEDDQVPLLLVPLQKSTAFMLVCEKRLTVYRDILTGPARSQFVMLHDQEPPQEPGSSKRLPIWTQWARPMRNKAHTELEDNIYICREDGVVHFLEIKDRARNMLDTTHKAGFLGVNINTSFAVIDMGFKGEVGSEPTDDADSMDMLIGCGDMSDGGRWTFKPREVAHKIDIIPNWTPLVNLTVIDSAKRVEGRFASAKQVSGADQGRTRFFTCTGRDSKHGRVTEIRYGIEAVRKSHLSDLQELAQIGITQVWLLNETNGGILVLLSYPTHTSLCVWGADEVLDPVDDTNYEIDYDAKTMAAGISADGMIVQVTANCVRASQPQMTTFDRPANILAACVRRSENDDNRMDLMVAVRNEHGVFLQLGSFGTSEQQIRYWSFGGPIELTSEPASVFLEFIADEYFAIVGTLESTLQVFRGNTREGVVSAYEYILNGEFAVCDSLAVLKMGSHPHIEHLLVCGLRNGAVEIIHINLESPGQLACSSHVSGLNCDLSLHQSFQFDGSVIHIAYGGRTIIPLPPSVYSSYIILISSAVDVDISLNNNPVCGFLNDLRLISQLTDASSTQLTCKVDDDLLRFCERIQIGSTTATVATDNTRNSRAIILCEQKLRCVEYPVNASAKAQAPASLNSVWLTDSDLPGFQQGKILAVTQGSSGFTQGLLLCVERSRIHMARIAGSSEPGMVPRHIHIKGTPTAALYSERLKMLVVLFYQIIITPAIERNGTRITPNQRSFEYKIIIIDPDVESISQKLEEGNDTTFSSGFRGFAGEEFVGVSEWFPNNGKDLHHVFVVHTVHGDPLGNSLGRIMFFNVSEKGLDFTKDLDEDGPVRALTVYGPNSLIYCCGGDLCLCTLDVRAGKSSGRFRILKPFKLGLGAEGLYISTNEPLVYVTTNKNGLLVFKIEENKIIPHLSGERERIGLHHLTIPELSLTITSQKDCTISGLWEPSKRSVEGLTSTVFEATLPGSITRFHQIRRPPWQNLFGLERSLAVSEPIIGISTNGAVYQFEILDEPSRSLLRFTQNMALRDRRICPFGDEFMLRSRHLDPCLNRRANLHVDGDIIRRLLDRDPENTLRGMLDCDPVPGNRPGFEADFASSSSRRERFEKLARAAGIYDWENGDQLIPAVIRWMRIRLQIAL